MLILNQFKLYMHFLGSLLIGSVKFLKKSCVTPILDVWEFDVFLFPSATFCLTDCFFMIARNHRFNFYTLLSAWWQHWFKKIKINSSWLFRFNKKKKKKKKLAFSSWLKSALGQWFLNLSEEWKPTSIMQICTEPLAITRSGSRKFWCWDAVLS